MAVTHSSCGIPHVFRVQRGMSLPHCPPKHRDGVGQHKPTAQTHPWQVPSSSRVPIHCNHLGSCSRRQWHQLSPSAPACLLLAIFGESLQLLPHSEQATSWPWRFHLSQSNKPGQAESPKCWSSSQRCLEMCGCFPVLSPAVPSLAGGCVLPPLDPSTSH